MKKFSSEDFPGGIKEIQVDFEKGADVGIDLERRTGLILEKIKSLVVENDTDLTAADKLICEWARLKKSVKEYWKPIKDSAKKIIDDVKNKENQMLSPIDSGSEIVIEKMGKYIKKRDEILQAEIDRKHQEQAAAAKVAAFEMAEEGIPEEAVQAMEELAERPKPVEVQHRTLKTKTTFKDDWVVEVIEGREHLVPNEYCIPVTAAMKAAVSANIKKIVVAKKGMIEIAGVRIIKRQGSIKRGRE